MILDLVDGDIAREKKMFSVLGSWGDSMTDKLIEGLILFAAYNLPSGLYIYMIANVITRPVMNYFLKPYLNQRVATQN